MALICTLSLLLWVFIGFITSAKAIDVPNIHSEYEASKAVENVINPFRVPEKPQPEEVCFPNLNCFHKNGTFKHLKWLPDPPKKIGTKFYLFTRQNPDLPVSLDYEDEGTLSNAYFDPKRPTKFISHGFTQSSQSTNIAGIKNAILEVEDANVIIVDWKNGAALPFYMSAAANTEVVGRQLAWLIHLLKKSQGLEGKDVHIIGFSLGSHLAGFAGKRLRDEMGIMLGRITGLDPASPAFEEADEDVHVSWKDAAYVDIIHTSAGDSIFSGDLGMVKAIGHSDFYPNGGKSQPGCSKIVCSHRRAMELLIHSILHNCEFRAYPCEGGYEEFQNGTCFSCQNGCNRMGYYSEPGDGARRKYYLLTRNNPPFCGVGIVVTLESSDEQTTTYGQVEVTLVGQDLLEDTIVLTKSKDHTLHASSHLIEKAVAHQAVFPVKQVKITYRKYKGWFTNGNPEWKIDALTVADEDGNVKFRYCLRHTTLTSGETVILHPQEC